MGQPCDYPRGWERTPPVQETRPSLQLEQTRPGKHGGQWAVNPGGAASGGASSPGRELGFH